MELKTVASKQVQSPEDRLATARHELTHALVAYGLGCRDVKMQVFRRLRKVSKDCKTGYLGLCWYRSPKPYYNAFILAAPYARLGKATGSEDEKELNLALSCYEKFTGFSVGFERFVFNPLRVYLESEPVQQVIEHLVEPLVERGTLQAANTHTFKRFFPRGLEIATLRQAVRTLVQKANDYPFSR